MKPLQIEMSKWIILLEQLHNDYPTSVMAIKEKTKRVLGFTSREHHIWIPNQQYKMELKKLQKLNDDDWDLINAPARGRYKNVMHLDFYSEEKRTFFILKYGEFL